MSKIPPQFMANAIGKKIGKQPVDKLDPGGKDGIKPGAKKTTGRVPPQFLAHQKKKRRRRRPKGA